MDGSARRREKPDLTQEAFDSLLQWLDQDRQLAGEKYEKIRSRLIKIFSCRGCWPPEELADETINRVARKTGEISPGYQGDPALYFYGVAHKLLLEYFKKRPVVRPLPSLSDNDENVDLKYDCLQKCLEDLPFDCRDLIMEYYCVDEKGAKKWRKALAQRLGIGLNALWIRAHRIRESLRHCMNQCLAREHNPHRLN